MAGPQDRVEKVITRLRERGHRLTPQRMAVLTVLFSSKEHPSVEQIYERIKADFPMTSLATIYKTVAVLKEIGEVQELGLCDDSKRYDANPYPHAHLICVKCKKIMDLDVDIVGGLPQDVAQRTGYQIVSHRLDFFGICPQCQEPSK